MKRSVETALMAALLALVTAAAAAGGPAPEGARPAAEAWVALVDQGEFGQAWDEAAPYFQKHMARDKWVEALEQHHTPLGQVTERRYVETKVINDPPGAPKGRYVGFVYDTAFSHGARVYEYVTVLRVDGQWRTVGYFLRPPEPSGGQEP